MDDPIAHEAIKVATAVAQKLEERETLYDERHAGLQKSIAEIKSMLTWVGGTMITMILSVLAWSLVQQYTANEAQKQALEEQIKVLQSKP